MEIHLVSSLTSDDESRLAPEMLAAIGRVLDKLPVSYSVRIETVVGNAIHQHHTAPQSEVPAAVEAAGTETVTLTSSGSTSSAPTSQ
jgi:hypothetical protein